MSASGVLLVVVLLLVLVLLLRLMVLVNLRFGMMVRVLLSLILLIVIVMRVPLQLRLLRFRRFGQAAGEPEIPIARDRSALAAWIPRSTVTVRDAVL